MRYLNILGIVLLILMNSCGASKKAVKIQADKEKVNKEEIAKEVSKEIDQSNKDLDINVIRYIATYDAIAEREMKEYGIPASITLAQGILESKAGKSELATNGKNHFGIKCHKGWQGKTILHDDNELKECFRKYDNPEASFKDHSKFLAQRKRYAFLFRLPKTDYEAWARGLKKAGYATDPSYPDKLIYIIEKYNLSKYDKAVLKGMSVKVDEKEAEGSLNKKKKFIYEVKKGETLFTISQKYDIPVKDIQSINNLNDFDIYEGQILVLTQNSADTPLNSTQEPSQAKTSSPKVQEVVQEVVQTTEVESGNHKTHLVKQGETLFSIAKMYHVSEDDLKSANNLSDNSISVGQQIIIPMDKVVEPVKEMEIIKENPVVKEKVQVSTPETSNTTSGDDKYHVVQPGETLYRIHVNYHIPIWKLRKLNHIKGNYIKVGQKLRLKE